MPESDDQLPAALVLEPVPNKWLVITTPIPQRRGCRWGPAGASLASKPDIPRTGDAPLRKEMASGGGGCYGVWLGRLMALLAFWQCP